ncbi:hypothetical protein [Nocardia asiatica]|uniref:hypothetical protein n=1 Tax=Nocardia asiatica TaxID=209252 RepID=UPI0005C19B5E|nr:hypothetical protein [Nocardia asiatica]
MSVTVRCTAAGDREGALTVKVVGTIDLFRWWKESGWSAIREAVLGEATPSGDDRSTETATPGAPAAPHTMD